MMKDRALTAVIQVNWEETELQLVSRQPGGFKRQGERGGKRENWHRGESWKGKDTFKTVACSLNSLRGLRI